MMPQCRCPERVFRCSPAFLRHSRRYFQVQPAEIKLNAAGTYEITSEDGLCVFCDRETRECAINLKCDPVIKEE